MLDEYKRYVIEYQGDSSRVEWIRTDSGQSIQVSKVQQISLFLARGKNGTPGRYQVIAEYGKDDYTVLADCAVPADAERAYNVIVSGLSGAVLVVYKVDPNAPPMEE